MRISSSVISQNVAFTLGYSAITLKDGINAVVHKTVFKNNSALWGGAMNAENHCQLTLNNCTFTSNKAVTGKTLNASKIPNIEMITKSINKNGTYPPWSPTSFNQTWLHHQKPKSISGKKLNISRRSARQPVYGNTIGTITPISPTLFNQTSFRPQTPEISPAKTMNNSTARTLGQNNTGTFTPIVRMLINQTSLAAKGT